PRVHAGLALVSGLATPIRAGEPPALSRRPRDARRARLLLRGVLAGLSPVRLVADHHPGVAGEPCAAASDLVEQSRAHHGRRARPRLPRAARLMAALVSASGRI